MNFLDSFVGLLPTIGFFILAGIVLVSAWMVGRVRRITHAAFFMVLAFTGVAGVYVMIGADFLAGSQILIYVGAIAVMFLFAIMVSDLKELSDNPAGRSPAVEIAAAEVAAGQVGAKGLGRRSDRRTGPAQRAGLGPWVVLSGLVALGFAGLVLAALGKSGIPAAEVAAAAGKPTTVPIGQALFTTFLVPFEVASVVLLVALVGAIVIAAREEERAGATGALQAGTGSGTGSAGAGQAGTGSAGAVGAGGRKEGAA